MFSFGIVLCEILAMIPADPEILPRTQVIINRIIDALEMPENITSSINFLQKKKTLLSPYAFMIACVAGLWPGRISIWENGQ